MLLNVFTSPSIWSIHSYKNLQILVFVRSYVYISSYSANSGLGPFIHGEAFSHVSPFKRAAIQGSQSETRYFTYISLTGTITKAVCLILWSKQWLENGARTNYEILFGKKKKHLIDCLMVKIAPNSCFVEFHTYLYSSGDDWTNNTVGVYK